MPERIVLSRAKGARKPPGAVTVDRTTAWGNPFKVLEPLGDRAWKVIWERPGFDPPAWWSDSRHGSSEEARTAAVAAFERWLPCEPGLILKARQELRGKDLACWCAAGSPCHAEVWLRVANSGNPPAPKRGRGRPPSVAGEPRSVQFTARLTEETARLLERRAKKLGLSKEAVLHRAAKHGLETLKDEDFLS